MPIIVKIQTEALDRGHLLSDITKVLSDHGVNILSGSQSTGEDRVAISQFTFEMADPKNLERLLADIRKIDGVFDCYRLTGQSSQDSLKIRNIR